MTSGVCTYLEWDSAFFGLRIARLAGNRLTPELIRESEAWSHEHRIDCLYFLADSQDPETAGLAEAHGFRFVDVRLTLQRRVTSEALAQRSTREFRAADAERLRSIARVSHRDSRFYYDAKFPESKCDALYETWIERSYSGWADAVLVAESDGLPGGYVTCHLSPSSAGSIGLMAIAPECHGRGLGADLVTAALEYFRTHGMQEVTVATQGRNVLAQRLYQRCGFLTKSVQLWYHKWFEVAVHP
ncbi:MAG: GNAT family N-acetyltransferase [Bryobacteraceae bacterium]